MLIGVFEKLITSSKSPRACSQKPVTPVNPAKPGGQYVPETLPAPAQQPFEHPVQLLLFPGQQRQRPDRLNQRRRRPLKPPTRLKGRQLSIIELLMGIPSIHN
jgi:hypothetical protein